MRSFRQVPESIDPDLVFKIRTSNSRIDDKSLERRNLVPLGETSEYLYFVLASDNGAALEKAVDKYTGGDDLDGAHGPLYTLFDRIEGLEPYSAEDRRGPGLDELSSEAEPYVVDVSIWPSDSYAESERRANVVLAVLAGTTFKVVRQVVGSRRTVLRVSVTAQGLTDILDTSVVERVRTPPVPFIDPSDWLDVGTDDLALDQVDGGLIGVIDDGTLAHPLLETAILSSTNIGPGGYEWPPPGAHGTQVAGTAVLPNLSEALRDGSPVIAVGGIHVARVLEPDPSSERGTRFAGGAAGLPPHEAIERAIRHLHEAHGVRVFNISIGFREPFVEVHVGELTEVIDDLVRELDIVVVVPTGNAPVWPRSETESGHHAERDYPAYLREPEHRLSEPGPAALAVTVGSVAGSDAPTVRGGTSNLHLKAIADVGDLSPFSRTGPGIGAGSDRINKPDFVAVGGNWVHDSDLDFVIQENQGVGIVTPALGERGRLFQATCGTSFAVPQVARCAADVLHTYPDASANLVRAILATSAADPNAGKDQKAIARRRRLFGSGSLSRVNAVDSGANRVTMTFDGAMSVDTATIHPVPVPDVFAAGARTTRAIRVALAFDPPVRRQRREYLAGTMQVDLYRAIDLEELAEIVKLQDPNNKKPLPKDKRRVGKLLPGPDSLKASTLHLRSWRPQKLSVDDGDTYYLVVTHRTQTWIKGSDYLSQGYALAVTLADEAREGVDLYSLVTQRAQLPAEVRVRA